MIACRQSTLLTSSPSRSYGFYVACRWHRNHSDLTEKVIASPRTQPYSKSIRSMDFSLGFRIGDQFFVTRIYEWRYHGAPRRSGIGWNPYPAFAASYHIGFPNGIDVIYHTSPQLSLSSHFVVPLWSLGRKSKEPRHSSLR